MSPGYCFCEHVTPLDMQTQVCVIMHYKEAGRASTNPEWARPAAETMVTLPLSPILRTRVPGGHGIVRLTVRVDQCSPRSVTTSTTTGPGSAGTTR